jgi:3-mercaptopyruvate sulfurtransferase SseA
MPDNSNKSFFPLLLIAVGFLLLIGAVTYIIFLARPEDQEYASDPGADGTFDDVPRVILSQAKSAFDAGSAVFVDVRDPGYFESSHIPGALSIPLGEIGSRLGELDPQDWIILYCT